MRIGFEAKWLHRGPPSGRRVVRSLVEALPAVAGEDELHLFLDARSREEPPPAGVDASRCHHVWGGNNGLSNVLAVPRAADRLGLDVVVYQNFVPPPRTVRHARVAFVYDAIFETHPRYFTWRERLYFRPMRALAASAERVCTGSESERARLVRHGYGAPSRIDVVPYAVDASFVPRDRLPESAARALAAAGVAQPFVLYAGRLNARKNVAALVRAIALLREPHAALVIAGAADATSDDLLAVAAAVGVSSRVRLLGSVSDELLRALYASATVFCFPSLDEGFGLCPLEAMACGAPVLVSRTPVLAEVCGDAAEYVDPRSPAEIAGALDALLADPARRASLREAGLRRAATFTWAHSARALLASARAAVRRSARSVA